MTAASDPALTDLPPMEAVQALNLGFGVNKAVIEWMRASGLPPPKAAEIGRAALTLALASHIDAEATVNNRHGHPTDRRELVTQASERLVDSVLNIGAKHGVD